MLSWLMLSGVCSSALSADLARYEVIAQHKLSAQVAETSGLACVGDSKYTINDSGNPAIIYQLDDQGQVITEVTAAINNRDWEALSFADGQLYIADIGNNHANRRNMVVYQLTLDSVRKGIAAEVSSTTFEFADYDTFPVDSVHHDVDAEAMAFNQEQLIVFSKSWRTNVARAYRIDPNQTQQRLMPIATIDNLPGMITGAHYDAASKNYWVVGYNSKGLPKLTPFIAQLDDSFNVVATKDLTGFGQVEAICMDKQRHLWLTQEQMLFKPALLIQMAPKL
ncbi:SdiA-regulated domain-containing protein [Neiella marina]|uniref:SdiA-regulated domain-containing protein n=1 Tax=Neiella marina TaxID=508461 RepID=UPI00130284E9|nr:SdiA-regulated domain-containing protein [Neiella marina]